MLKNAQLKNTGRFLLAFIICISVSTVHASGVDFELAVSGVECLDGVDNDGDGLVDFPDDTDCESAEDTSESNDTPPSGGGVSQVVGGGGILFGAPGEDQDISTEEPETQTETDQIETDTQDQDFIDNVSTEPVDSVDDVIDSVLDFIDSIISPKPVESPQDAVIKEQLDDDVIIVIDNSQSSEGVEVINSQDQDQPVVVIDGQIQDSFDTILPDKDTAIMFIVSIIGLFFVGYMVVRYHTQPGMGKKCNTGVVAVISGLIFLGILGFLYSQMVSQEKLYHYGESVPVEIRTVSQNIHNSLVLEYSLYYNTEPAVFISSQKRSFSVGQRKEILVDQSVAFEDLYPGAYRIEVTALTSDGPVVVYSDTFSVLENTLEQHRMIAYVLMLIGFLLLLARGLCLRFVSITPPLG